MLIRLKTFVVKFAAKRKTESPCQLSRHKLRIIPIPLLLMLATHRRFVLRRMQIDPRIQRSRNLDIQKAKPTPSASSWDMHQFKNCSPVLARGQRAVAMTSFKCQQFVGQFTCLKCSRGHHNQKLCHQVCNTFLAGQLGKLNPGEFPICGKCRGTIETIRS